MRVYTIVTGIAFFAIACVHMARLLVEGSGEMDNPIFMASTIVALALSAWAIWTFKRTSH